MEIIDRIFALMESTSTTAAQLTREVPLTNGLVTQWKQGKQKPSVDAIIKIAQYFKVSTDYILTGQEKNFTNERENAKMDDNWLPNTDNWLPNGVNKESMPMDKSDNNNAKSFATMPFNVVIRALRLEFGYSTEKLARTIHVPEHYCKDLEELTRYDHLSEEYSCAIKKAVEFYSSPNAMDGQFIGNIRDINRYIPEKLNMMGEYNTNLIPEFENTDLNMRIKRQLRREKITVDTLADEMGLEVISIISWLTGERIPNRRCLDLLNGSLNLGDDIMRKYVLDTEKHSLNEANYREAQ